jgi:hypothetical protein
MTLSQLSTLVLSWLDDEQQGYFNSTDITTWMNLAHRQVQLELLQAGWNWYMKPVETYTVYGQADYLWPSDFLVEHRLECVLSGTGATENRQPISPITTNMSDLVPLAQSTPTNYYIKKDRFTLTPVPDSGGAGPSGAYLMRLYYSYMVPDLVNPTDVPDVPEQFMEMVALYAAFNGFIKDDRAPQNLLSKKEEMKVLMRQSSVDRTQDMARQVVQVQEYDDNGWMY